MKGESLDQEARPSVNPLQIVNVSSVPKRSPFRYPGGKTWLVPHIRTWLRSRSRTPNTLVEPFAGGGIVGLTAAFESLAGSVVLVEKDQDVSSVWRTILDCQQGRWLAERIAAFEFSPEAVKAELATPRCRLSNRQRAFKTLLRNRVQRGGILAPGAGLIKVGENGKGMASRWYPETLKKRILDICDIRIRSRINFVEGDGIEVLSEYRNRRDVVFFVDPPYTVAGGRLYTYSEIDHEALFAVVGSLKGDFLMTYDNTNYIRSLAENFGFATRQVAMKSTHHAKMTELLIGRNLDWLPAPEGISRLSMEAQASLEFEPQTALL
ncbi:MAG: DNA adenine methylase [Bryobacterales bacterium]|nr:DNA adenine methylase [Bryobacterales bacterium]